MAHEPTIQSLNNGTYHITCICGKSFYGYGYVNAGRFWQQHGGEG